MNDTPILPSWNTPLPAETQKRLSDLFSRFWKKRIQLPNPLPLKGKFNACGYEIHFATCIAEGNLPCLDFYAVGQGLHDRHIRISLAEEIIELPVYLDPAVEILQVYNKTHFLSLKRIEDYNEMVYEILKSKGFVEDDPNPPPSFDDNDQSAK